MKYQEVYDNWRRSPEDFWSKEAQNIDWFDKPETVLDASNKPFYNWFIGGSVNACYNCIDRHVEKGNGDRLAIIYDSAVRGKVVKFTYPELQKKVSV